jgi:hypothetical protein
LWGVTSGAIFLPDLNKGRHGHARMTLSTTIKVESEVLVGGEIPVGILLN